MKLLKQFQAVFEGNLYRHRSSTHGDRVAQYLYEDLYDLNQSPKFRDRVDDESVVLGSANRTHGVKHRRGDGSLGPIVPGESAIRDPGFVVARGSLATIQIGVEVKILAKAMIKQIDRVIGDLKRQAEEFRRSNPQAIALGIVGVNHACSYRSVEGDRVYETGKGKSGPHPIHEAPAAILRLDETKPAFDEFLILRFGATNREPYSFDWVDSTEARRDYSSALVRIAGSYQHRF
ncbi:hypothetical protein [Candidatus Palauibacter sp.]|uniref:hypothetical protein n=1 Tax=Candidatus Palauibacter sp. TaxID=3101350 RepID=UPI003AF305E4